MAWARCETPQWRGGITGGIWQSVRLVATGEVLVKDVFIEPKIADDSATLHLELENTGTVSKSVQLEMTIRSAKDPDRIVAKSIRTVSLRPGVSKHSETLQVPNARYWSPEDPHLYQAEVTVEGSDRWTSRFGMREFTIRDKQFQLNGKRVFTQSDFLRRPVPHKNRLSRQSRDGNARDSVGQGCRIQHDSTLAATTGTDVVGSGR